MKYTLFFLSAIISLVTIAQNPKSYKVTKTFHIASPGGWDYLVVNNNKLYVSHSIQVNILDEMTGDSLGFIPNTNGVHGIAFENSLGKGYTSNGRTNNVSVFDLKTNQLRKQIPTGENPDAINFEPFTKTIITCNGRGKNLSVIDPVTDSVIKTIDVGGKPEAAVSDGKGKFFVNIEDKNEIIVVDMKTLSVVNHWPLTPGEGPTGLAFDKKTNRLFAGCDKLLVVLNSETGTVIEKIKIGDGCDGVAFDNKNKLIFTSNGEGNISVIKENSPDSYEVLGNYETKRGARTIAFDEDKGMVFVPTADFEAATTPGTRPKMIPGSFQVLVIQAVK